MGGNQSRSSASHKKSLYAAGSGDRNGSGVPRYQRNELYPDKPTTNLTTPQQQEQSQEPKQNKESISLNNSGTTRYDGDAEEFYDGIPRYPEAVPGKSRSMRSKQGTVTKVSEVNSRLSRAGSVGLGKVVDVLDTLGSSMVNLNSSSGFVYGVATKGNEISTLAFEVANTIVKGSSLMQSLSKRNMRQLKEVILPSEGVQYLVSEDMDELLRIVAADKREELKIFVGEVVRFGNLCKNSQWHNLDRYFEKRGRQLSPNKQLKEEAESVMQQLMTLVQNTAELYHKLHALDRFEQDYQSKRVEDDNPFASNRGDSPAIRRENLKNQRKQVKNLKKKSLWSKILEEVMEKLVDIVLFLNREIHNAFCSADDDKPLVDPPSKEQRLGPAGLALHYANIILQIDTVVARSSSLPLNLRGTLYQSLPPSIKSSLRSKLQSFHVKEEFTVTDIKAEMEKTLSWLVPTATNTAKAHHSFGWVGEWASTGSEGNRRPTGPGEVMWIETLHHADKEKTEAYILELLLWLNHLVSKSKIGADGGQVNPSVKPPIGSSKQETTQQAVLEASTSMPSAAEELRMLQNGSNKNTDTENEQDSGV